MAKNLKSCIVRCSEARKRRDWQTMLRECESAISMGAHSSPKVFCSKAEALLKLGKHADADSVMSNATKFDTDEVTSFFGAITNGYILMVQAQIHMASGRFNEAIAASQRAAELDQSNQEISTIVRRIRAVAAARNRGNELFKASKYAEACMTYREGLDNDPQNAVLLCNRAACHSKLGQWEKAVDECSTALGLRPSYTKARIRRADCYVKLEKWEEAVKDYEILIRELPGDGDLMKGLSEAKSQLYRNHLGS
ncbi:hypothetical protein HPP92_005239 [Vanilla planifolia]|uniref:Uncharacterized protein n=1 Tax=Vanilla planifolia TaxID=51239 RepID=A0A835VEP6_VANPL|nr:hypothetical protein HPP92_005239 [Vanilla planifolia]